MNASPAAPPSRTISRRRRWAAEIAVGVSVLAGGLLSLKVFHVLREAGTDLDDWDAATAAVALLAWAGAFACLAGALQACRAVPRWLGLGAAGDASRTGKAP